MFGKNIAASARDFKTGFSYLAFGARTLATEKHLWPLIVAPVIVNIVLFVLFLFGLLHLVGTFFTSRLPDVWWAFVIGGLVLVATIGAFLFLCAVAFVFVGSIISAPFYDVLAEKSIRSLGGIVPDHPWWKSVGRSMKYAAALLATYVFAQAGLLFLSLVPPPIGQISYISLGFAVTTFFLALGFLTYSFDARGWTLTQRRSWCIRRKGLVLGFGSAVFLALGIPFLNVFVPPIAILGSVRLFHDHS